MATLNFSITIDDSQVQDFKQAFGVGDKTNAEARNYLVQWVKESIRLRMIDYLKKIQSESLAEPIVNVTGS